MSSSVQPQATTETDSETVNYRSHDIDIDFKSLVDLLSVHLYSDKSAAIRELLSNANDALIACEREHKLNEDESAIHIWLTRKSVQLVVSDNGIGMSEDDLLRYLGTIGASLTRGRREDILDNDLLIGNFGIGFLSSFIVADRILVQTRKRGHTGFCWESRGERDYRIIEEPDLPYGTTVTLDLKPKVLQEWNEEKIKRMILENARNFIFPIYWGKDRAEKLNDLQAPWYNQHRPTEKEAEKYRNFLKEYDEKFASAKSCVEIIPLHDESIRGVVYIPAKAEMSHEKTGIVDIYCKRVFVRADDFEILPNDFNFLKGIIDCSKFKLNAARDDVIRDNYAYLSVVKFICDQVLNHFQSIARDANQNFEGDRKNSSSSLSIKRLSIIFDQLHIQIKKILTVTENDGGNYLYDDEYLISFENFMPFRSSLLGITTLPEYLARKDKDPKGRTRELLFLRRGDDITTNRSLSEQEKREFILIEHPSDEDYLKRHCEILGIRMIHASDVLRESLPVLEAAGGWAEIVRYFQDRLSHPEISLTVHLSDFDPSDIAGRLLVDREAEGLHFWRAFREQMGTDRSIDKNHPMFKELERMTQRQPQLLYLNKRNAVLDRLSEVLDAGPDSDAETILHDIFHDIAIAADCRMSDIHVAEYRNRVYTKALDGMEERTKTRQIQNEISELENRLAEAQDKIQLMENIEPNRVVINENSRDVFFIRPMKDGKDKYDFISEAIAKVFDTFKLDLIDPKKRKIPGNILKEIIDFLQNSRLVIADVSELDNPNIFYEVGYVCATLEDRLILIADQDVKGQLPFDITTQRVLFYADSAQAFHQFSEDLKHAVSEMLKEK